MYNMGAANRNGLNHSLTLEQRKQIMAEAAEQRYTEFLGGETKYTSGTVHQLTKRPIRSNGSFMNSTVRREENLLLTEQLL